MRMLSLPSHNGPADLLKSRAGLIYVMFVLAFRLNFFLCLFSSYTEHVGRG